MMSNIDKILEREINSVYQEALGCIEVLKRKGKPTPKRIISWAMRVSQLISQLYGNESLHFRTFENALHPGKQNIASLLHSDEVNNFLSMIGVAQAIKHDLDNGLLANFRAIAQAEVFSDFLEMGEYLLQEGYKDAAAVIIGGVLENGLRKLAEKNSIATTNDSGKPLTIDPLNTELAKREIYSKLIQKQITSWAHIRNKAAHGEYGEYNREQVQMMLLFVQNFMSEHLN